MEQIKTTSIGYLLQQVQSRFKINNTNWRADAIDNVGNIVNEIGYHTGYTSKKIPLRVVNFKVKVPSEVVNIDYIFHNNFPLVNITNMYDAPLMTFNKSNLRAATGDNVLELNKETERLETLKDLYIANPTDELLEKIQDSQRKIKQLVEATTYNSRLNDLRCAWFMFEGGYIKTSFEEGTLVVNADTYIVDENGLPMVVDTHKYREACIWGIMYYLLLQGYVHPVVTLPYAEEQKDMWIMRAQNEPKIFTIERHQQFTETWSSISRGINNQTLDNLYI